ncbi:hypothetical protein F5Y10DRAFT_253251 [Nemania abortiva]|nr:hypothetical protein F5Y10DRAFT_253251 [Nemania abortiva]
MAKIAIVGASGKLGGATLAALLTHKLASPSDIIALTSSTPDSATWAKLAATGVQVRHARFEEPATFERALDGVDRFFLVSTPNIGLDYGVAMDFDGTTAEGSSSSATNTSANRGRESHHKQAIDAAVKAGVKWITYSSLAYAFSPSVSAAEAMNTSKAGVMRAHLRTEAYLRSVGAAHGIAVTILREGLYNESWPLYLGNYDVGNARGERDIVPLAADGKVCWSAIHDLGVASALVLSSGNSGEEFVGRTFYLSTRPATAKTVGEIAQLVGKARGKDVRVEIVGRKEHERYYVEERGTPRPAVEWWVGTYEALEAGEALVDDPMLEKLLGRVGLKPIPVEETVAAMVKG